MFYCVHQIVTQIFYDQGEHGAIRDWHSRHQSRRGWLAKRYQPDRTWASDAISQESRERWSLRQHNSPPCWREPCFLLVVPRNKNKNGILIAELNLFDRLWSIASNKTTQSTFMKTTSTILTLTPQTKLHLPKPSTFSGFVFFSFKNI